MRSDRDVYEELAAQLVRFASVVAHPDDAEDVVSVVMTRVLAKGKPLDSFDDPRAYLMRAVINESRKRHRSLNREVALITRLGSPLPEPDTAHGRYPDLTEAVMRLPSQQRAAIFLVYWMGMTSLEAGNAMGCGEGTVRRYLSLARKKLEAYGYE